MKPDELEQKLSRQPLREIPGEWRGKILSAARAAQEARHASRIRHQSFLSTLNHQLSTVFWPHPKAWAALAAVWVAILALNLSARDTARVMAEKSTPPSPEVVAELKQQRQLFAELVGAREAHDADRSKSYPPKPRTWRAEPVAV